MLDPGTNFLAKPFSPEQQLAEIRRVLGARASRQQAG
jgi:DNA-binding NtrC family response regulator